jgi:Uma2 family endonuclease
MSLAVPASPLAARPPALFLRRFSVEEYHRMIQAGVFAHDDRFELLEGWIVAKMSRNPPHDVALDKSQDAIRQRLPNGWRLRIQSAITTADSEPEPDLAVVRGPAERYMSAHPMAPDIALVVEVAESSLSEDRTDKARIYARAGIGDYWIVNLIDSVIEVYADPTGDVPAPQYRDRDTFHAGQSIPMRIDGKQIASVPVNELLP